ncbi:unnamed protein product [Pelagomonas calceolata]|uniref:Uncharacterized protein n=1 Tax=Pelagomonas calceolata TaxID=35677 RepID=A0A8J2SRH7_9STRA|nr:unnamed protein product [Pelagomonas calceolata]
MAAVAAEANGEPLFGQVVGQLEPSPLMDERVLRRLCGMLGVPAAGSLADQAAACRAALLGGEPEPAAVAPRGQAMERAYEGTARGSVESLGRWNEKGDDRAMPVKLKAETLREKKNMVRVGFGKLVDELVQTKGASSGILAISNWKKMRGPHEVTVSGVSWSASPDDVSYQRHGFVGMESGQRQNIRFPDFEGVVDDFGEEDQIAVYRVTLPSGGLRGKWAGRPPPPAPEDLYTGPRSDGLLSTEEISGEYSAACICAGCPWICNSMTVVPLGPDMIETWRTCCLFCPPFIGPIVAGGVQTRNPGTNTFRDPHPSKIVTFSADGTARATQGCGNFKKRRTSQKRTFQKVDARDLAGNWRGCFCHPLVYSWPFSPVFCTTKTALNEDQYEESGRCCFLCLPIPISGTHTRVYVNGHPTNGFDSTNCCGAPDFHWHRDPGCAAQNPGSNAGSFIFAKKVG